jgi:hypothetical protein
MSLQEHWLSINKTCKFTGISKRNLLSEPMSQRNRALYAPIFSSLTLLILFLTGCTSVRPVVKIGLIAPFEGLYRDSGYAALAAMRQALDECTPPGVDVLPLALDDSGDPAQAQRAAKKLLVDPAVHAVVGPLLLDAVPAVATVMAQATEEREGARASNYPTWLNPLLIAPIGGFAEPSADAWLEAQLEYVAAITTPTRILLVGLSAGWPLEVNAGLPVVRIDDPAEALDAVAEGDTVVWLGRPDEGARWLTTLHAQHVSVDFWLVDQAGIDIFTALTPDLQAIHWLVWTDVEYNSWLQSATSVTQPNDLMRYRIYRATCTALDRLYNDPAATPPGWELQQRPIQRQE